MKQDELHLERQCRSIARAHGWMAWKNERNGNKGIPDDSFLHPDGRFFLVEFKKNATAKPRQEQRLWLEKFPDTARLIYSVEQFCDLLQISPDK